MNHSQVASVTPWHERKTSKRRRCLATVLNSNCRLFFLCFNDEEPGAQGPRRVSRKDIEDAFAHGWQIESIEPSRYKVRPDPNDISFSDGGP